MITKFQTAYDDMKTKDRVGVEIKVKNLRSFQGVFKDLIATFQRALPVILCYKIYGVFKENTVSGT